MSTPKRFGVLFFIALFSSAHPTFASENNFGIPENISEDLTKLMQIRCKPISCGEDGHSLRSTTPDEYSIFNKDVESKEPYKIVDFFVGPFGRIASDCLFSLYNAKNTLHPVAKRMPEKEEEHSSFLFGELNYSFFDPENILLGFISVEPHKTTGLTSPHINYYILKEHQGKKYSTPMIAGFVKHLQTLEGKKYPQITLPNAADCLKILRNTLAETADQKKLSLSDILSSMTIVGPIHAHVPLENPPSFVPTSKVLFFTGFFHLEPHFSKSLGRLIDGITPEETRAVGTWLFFSSQKPEESDFSGLRKALMILFQGYCTAKREERPALYPTLRDKAFAVVDEDTL